MSMQTKTIGRMPTDHGPYDPQFAYGKKFTVTLFDCGWESKHDNNTSAPAILNAQAGTITENTTDWKKVWGSYKQWLIDNGYQKMDASDVKDGNNTQHDINVTFASEIGDDSTPNSIKGRVTTLEEAVGTGGSVDERIATEGAKHYLKSETYTKEEVNGMITTPEQGFVSVSATSETTAATDVLPATGEADTIYRVGNWDGSQYDTSVYSEYSWNTSTETYIKLSTKQVGIDDEPEAGSNNMVKSGGVYNRFASIQNIYTENISVETSVVKNINYPVTERKIYFSITGITNYVSTLYLYAGTTRIQSINIITDTVYNFELPANCTSLALYVGSTQTVSGGSIDVVISNGTVVEHTKALESLMSQIDGFMSGNIISTQDWLINMSLNSSGEEYIAVGGAVTKYIKVKPSSKLYFPRTETTLYGSTIYEYASDKSYIRNNTTSNFVYLELGETTEYIRVLNASSTIDKVCIYQDENNAFCVREAYKSSFNGLITNKSLDLSGITYPQGTGENLFYTEKSIYGLNYDNYGNIVLNSNYRISGKIPVMPLMNYYFVNGNLAVCYNKDNEVVDVIDVASSSAHIFRTVKEAVYARINYRYDSINIMFVAMPDKLNTLPSYSAFVGTPFIAPDLLNLDYLKKYCRDDKYEGYFFGKKMAVDGDSITNDDGTYTYWQYIAANNYGLTLVGSTFEYSGETYTIGTKGIAGSRIAYGTEQNTKPYCISARYQDLPSDAELIVINGGTNDWAHNGVELGTMADRTNITFYGALHVLCKGLIEKYPSKTIMFMTPIKRTVNLDAVNDLGLKLSQFADAIIEVCGYYGIPVLDMFRKCTLNPSITQQQSLYFIDDTHPNVEGHFRMGTTVSGFLKTLV